MLQDNEKRRSTNTGEWADTDLKSRRSVGLSPTGGTLSVQLTGGLCVAGGYARPVIPASPLLNQASGTKGVGGTGAAGPASVRGCVRGDGDIDRGGVDGCASRRPVGASGRYRKPCRYASTTA
jgi:hypothetical protein